MSKTSLSASLKREILAKSAGRCEFKGCGKYLNTEKVTGKKIRLDEHAHIISDSPKGPRGDEMLSLQLGNDISNIMLLCLDHHKLIDTDSENYSIEQLKSMKKEHEEGIEFYLNRIHTQQKTKVVIYKSNIGTFKDIPTNRNDICQAITDYYPDPEIVDLFLTNNNLNDSEKTFWEIEERNLEEVFMSEIRKPIEKGEIEHLSVFALAPQPLLIKLGTLLTDIATVDIYQKHREPSTWQWQEEITTKYQVVEPTEIKENIALVFSLSFTINDERIYEVLGQNTSIWKVTIDEPNPHFIRCKNQLKDFRQFMMSVYDRIKAIHGEKSIINLFPSVPVSIAVEIGRVRLPKSDLPIKIFDQNNGKFIETIIIKRKKEEC